MKLGLSAIYIPVLIPTRCSRFRCFGYPIFMSRYFRYCIFSRCFSLPVFSSRIRSVISALVVSPVIMFQSRCFRFRQNFNRFIRSRYLLSRFFSDLEFLVPVPFRSMFRQFCPVFFDLKLYIPVLRARYISLPMRASTSFKGSTFSMRLVYALDLGLKRFIFRC